MNIYDDLIDFEVGTAICPMGTPGIFVSDLSKRVLVSR